MGRRDATKEWSLLVKGESVNKDVFEISTESGRMLKQNAFRENIITDKMEINYLLCG